jgi:hypothetical protein
MALFTAWCLLLGQRIQFQRLKSMFLVDKRLEQPSYFSVSGV